MSAQCWLTRPSSVTASGARNQANFSGFGCGGRQLMGQPLGGHPNTVYGRNVCLPALVAVAWRASRAIKKMLLVPRRYGRAASFDRTRAAQLL
jgi:hypothetical protein